MEGKKKGEISVCRTKSHQFSRDGSRKGNCRAEAVSSKSCPQLPCLGIHTHPRAWHPQACSFWSAAGNGPEAHPITVLLSLSFPLTSVSTQPFNSFQHVILTPLYEFHLEHSFLLIKKNQCILHFLQTPCDLGGS